MKSLTLLAIAAPLISAIVVPEIPHPPPFPGQQYFNSTALLDVVTTHFNTSIEGAAVDASGNAYACNYGTADQRNQIGKVELKAGKAVQSLDFAYNDTKTGFNGIRFVCDDKKGSSVYLAADQNNKRVVKVKRSKNGKPVGSVFCSDPKMLQGVPNDLAVDLDKQNVYLTGQAWMENTTAADGEIWLCKGGVAKKLSDNSTIFGRTNGIEISNDGKTLYVSEATNANWNPVTNKIISFQLAKDGTLVKGSRKVFYDFADDKSGDVDIDGMRLDIAGNLYVTRNGGGQVVVFDTKTAKIIKKIPLVTTAAPTNLELVGRDGKTVVVVGRCPMGTAYQTGVGCFESFRVPFAGKAYTDLLIRSDKKCTW
ncbi:hypothetical protein HK098_003648 [Nowakowskiella sp. JEL0407]|nr:hypothetical protein HK098_003648 [Nowakowskiella sp. JEL0407]